MTQSEYGLVLSFFLVTAAFSVYQRFGPLRRERLKVCRYSLFAVRDKMVLLVAEGHIDEDDESFQFLYESINEFIPLTKPLTLRAMVEGLNAIHFEHIREDDEVRRRFVAAVNHKNVKVRRVAREFFETIADILFDRSVLVWASAVTTHRGWSALRGVATGCRSFLTSVAGRQVAAYEYYKAATALAKGY